MRITGSNNLWAATLVAALLFSWSPQTVMAQDAQMVYQLQALLEEVRVLRGQVESQQVEIENLRRRQRDQYLDLDQRLQVLGQQSMASGSSDAVVVDDPAPDSVGVGRGGQAASAIGDLPEVRAPIQAQAEIISLPLPATGGERDLAQPNENEQVAYDEAFRSLREARYADAAGQFNRFIDLYPSSTYAPNAYYWLAETYYVTRDFETALAFFSNVLDLYPDSSKAGDALLKLGFSHFELQQWPEARAALEQVRADYPDTTLSRLAESRLRDMRLSGRL